MDALLSSLNHHAAPLFVIVVAAAVLAGWLYWQRRPDGQAKPALAMLRKRTAVIIAICTASLFALLAVAIEADGRLVAWDQHVTDTIRARISPFLLNVLAIFTRLGDSKLLIIASALIALALLLRGHRLLATSWCLGLLGNGLLIRIGKDWFQRVRPVHDHGFVVEAGYSFPSGHAAGSLMFYGLLAYVLAVLLPTRWQPKLLMAAIVVVLLIGSSRVLLQVHFVSDVCAGFALGIGWLALCIAAIEFLRSSRKLTHNAPATIV